MLFCCAVLDGGEEENSTKSVYAFLQAGICESALAMESVSDPVSNTTRVKTLRSCNDDGKWFMEPLEFLIISCFGTHFAPCCLERTLRAVWGVPKKVLEVLRISFADERILKSELILF